MTRREFLYGAAAAPVASGGAPAGRPPNILLIIADDLGYADLGCYGNAEVKTPHIDRLAAEGVRFTDFAVSWPACTPSRSSILTGRYPQRNGLYDMIRNNEVNFKFQFDEESYAVSPEMTLGLDVREVTTGQVLKKAGYRTGVVGKWDSGRARRFLPLQRGFDFFYGFANTGIDYYNHERYGVPSMFRGNERIKETGHATDLFRREAIRFIDESKDRPFFLHLAPNAPHGASTFDRSARQVPEEYLEMYRRHGGRKAEHLALVGHLDDAVGAILNRLRELNLEKDTLVFFVSDNGGTGPGNNGSLRGRKAQLFEGGIRVPMIARWPGRIAPGRVINEFAASLEFLPTFCAAAGAGPPAGVKLDGLNMLPLLEGKASSPRKDCFWQRRSDRAARIGSWKWVSSKDGSGLFDLSTDAGEKRDWSSEKPQVLEMVQSRWNAWRREMDASEPRGPFRDY